jgi:hypothetical protein
MVVRYWKTPPLSDLAGLLLALLEVETRLRTVVPEDIHDVPHEAPKHPLQVLYVNDDIEAAAAACLQRAFGVGLAVNRGAGKRPPLHYGNSLSLRKAKIDCHQAM